MNNKIKPGIYLHYKNKKYRVMGVAKDRDTLEDLVVYEALYENKVSKLWVGKLSAFCDKVEVDGRLIPRFKYMLLDSAEDKGEK